MRQSDGDRGLMEPQVIVGEAQMTETQLQRWLVNGGWSKRRGILESGKMANPGRMKGKSLQYSEEHEQEKEQ